MYIYKPRIGIYVIKQALLLEEVETTLHHVKIEHIVRCLQAAKPYYKQLNFSNLNPHSKLKILGSTLTGHKLVGTMDRSTVQWRSGWYLDAGDIFMHKKSPQSLHGLSSSYNNKNEHHSIQLLSFYSRCNTKTDRKPKLVIKLNLWNKHAS